MNRLLFFFLFFTAFECSKAHVTTGSITADTNKYLKNTLSFLIGFPFPAQSSEFSDIYREQLGGINDYYTPSILITIKFQIPAVNNFNFGLLWETFSTEFKDSFYESFEFFGKNIVRTYNQQLDISTMPLMLTVEYSPSESFYREYLGLGMGFCFDDIYWYEEVGSNYPNDIRTSGLRYDDRSISPALKLYFGLLLNFDKKYYHEFLGALHFEVSINYIYRSLKVYENFNELFLKPKEEFTNNYLVLPFYLSLTTGISFNLFHKLK